MVSPWLSQSRLYFKATPTRLKGYLFPSTMPFLTTEYGAWDGVLNNELSFQYDELYWVSRSSIQESFQIISKIRRQYPAIVDQIETGWWPRQSEVNVKSDVICSAVVSKNENLVRTLEKNTVACVWRRSRARTYDSPVDSKGLFHLWVTKVRRQGVNLRCGICTPCNVQVNWFPNILKYSGWWLIPLVCWWPATM